MADGRSLSAICHPPFAIRYLPSAICRLPMDTTWLNLAIQATEQNDLPRARELLRGYVRYHSKDAQGWLWLSRAAETPDERDYALARVQALQTHSHTPVPAPRIATPRPAVSKRTARSAPRVRMDLRQIAQWSIFAIAAILFFVVAIAVVPMFLGHRTLVVLSGSMEPAIPKGAAVIAQPVPSKNLQSGDVIIFSPSVDAPVPIIHRIVSIREKNGATVYTTKGDANNAPDPTEISLPPTAWTARVNIPLVGYVISFASSSLGIALLIVAPVLGILSTSAWDWLKRKRSALSAST